MGCVTVLGQAMGAAPEAAGRQGATLYVSKLGNNTDGQSWATAFTTIQAALDAVPDDQGGHRIVVRPDTYLEAMLSPRLQRASGAYNELVGDVDGRYGSGTSGHVVIDSGDPARSRVTTGGRRFAPLRAGRPRPYRHLFAIIWDR